MHQQNFGLFFLDLLQVKRHTRGQQLSFHPHIQYIVIGGGIANDNTWKEAKKNSYRFLSGLGDDRA